MSYVNFPHLGIELEMNPVITLPFGIRVYWYAVIIAAGIVVSILLAEREFKRCGYDTNLLYDFVFVAVPLGILGARLYYVIFRWDLYKDNLSDIFKIWNGGLAIYGGIITGIVVALIYTRRKNLPFLWLADVGSMCLFIAQSMGRWGNFINAEAFGRETSLPWGMIVDGPKVKDGPFGPCHPTFLYESLWNLAGFCISYFILRKRKRADGVIFAFYMMWYGVGRFFIEELRTDSLYLINTELLKIKVSQLVAILSLVAGIVIAVLLLKGVKKEKIEE